MNIIWIIVGFMGGVIMAKNSAEMDAPSVAAVIFAMVAGCGVAWSAAYHGKRQAVASAVATATAVATAKARSEANAAAQSIVNLYGGAIPNLESGLVPTQRYVLASDVTEDRQLTQGEQSNGQVSHEDRSVGHRRGFSYRPLRTGRDTPRRVSRA